MSAGDAWSWHIVHPGRCSLSTPNNWRQSAKLWFVDHWLATRRGSATTQTSTPAISKYDPSRTVQVDYISIRSAQQSKAHQHDGLRLHCSQSCGLRLTKVDILDK